MSARQTFPRLDGYAQAQYVVKNAAADEASQALDLLDSQAAEITRLTSERDTLQFRLDYAAVQMPAIVAHLDHLRMDTNEDEALRLELLDIARQIHLSLAGGEQPPDLRAEVARLTEANEALRIERVKLRNAVGDEIVNSGVIRMTGNNAAAERDALREVRDRLIEALREMHEWTQTDDCIEWAYIDDAATARFERCRALLAGAASPVQESPK